jgi:hypothetical protein
VIETCKAKKDAISNCFEEYRQAILQLYIGYWQVFLPHSGKSKVRITKSASGSGSVKAATVAGNHLFFCAFLVWVRIRRIGWSSFTMGVQSSIEGSYLLSLMLEIISEVWMFFARQSEQEYAAAVVAGCIVYVRLYAEGDRRGKWQRVSADLAESTTVSLPCIYSRYNNLLRR